MGNIITCSDCIDDEDDYHKQRSRASTFFEEVGGGDFHFDVNDDNKSQNSSSSVDDDNASSRRSSKTLPTSNLSSSPPRSQVENIDDNEEESSPRSVIGLPPNKDFDHGISSGELSDNANAAQQQLEHRQEDNTGTPNQEDNTGTPNPNTNTTIPKTLSPAISEFQSILDDSEQNCDLLFLSNYSKQQQQDDGNGNAKDSSFRCFALLIHETYGMLLLHCTNIPRKGPHYQVPGGYIEQESSELKAKDPQKRYIAGRTACSRYIEVHTGLKIPNSRLWPLVAKPQQQTKTTIHDDEKKNNDDDQEMTMTTLINEHKQRLLYVVKVTDQDFMRLQQEQEQSAAAAAAATANRNAEEDLVEARNYNECPLKIKLDNNMFSGFRMEKSCYRTMGMLKTFNGGRITKMIGMAVKWNQQQSLSSSSFLSIVNNSEEGTTDERRNSSRSNNNRTLTTIETNMTTSTPSATEGKDDDCTVPTATNKEVHGSPSSNNKVVLGFQRLLDDAKRDVDLDFLSSSFRKGDDSLSNSTTMSTANDDGQQKEAGNNGGLSLSSSSNKNNDLLLRYQGFVFVVHESYGLLLLQTTNDDDNRTNNKSPPNNYQTPGGYVAEADIDDSIVSDDDTTGDNTSSFIPWTEKCYLATRATCVRELQEVLGLSISPNRLRPAITSSKQKRDRGREGGDSQQEQGHQKGEAEEEEEEVIVDTLIAFKKRFFYVLELNDNDDIDASSLSPTTYGPGVGGDDRYLSSSKSKFTDYGFEKNPIKAIELLEKHSGGHVSKALWMALKVVQ